MSLDSSSETVSLTIEGSFTADKFTVGKANLYKRNCDNELKFVEIIWESSAEFKWTAPRVLDLNHVHSNACTSLFIEFVMKIDLFCSDPIISEVSKTLFDFENTKYYDTIVAVKEKQFKVLKSLLMERSEVFEKMVRLLTVDNKMNSYSNVLTVQSCHHQGKFGRNHRNQRFRARGCQEFPDLHLLGHGYRREADS